MKIILKKNSLFIVPYLIFLLSGAFVLIVNSKTETHLKFNTFHNPFFDSIFYYLTFLGDGITALLVFIMLLAVKFRYAIIIGISNIIASSITQILKHTLFSEMLRPKKFFEGIHDLYLVPGVDNYLYNSFPSGHSTCAFSLYFALALIVQKKTLKFFFFLIALMISLSRVYLSQHFFEDIYVGSLIGVSATVAVFYLIQKYNNNWLEKSMITLIKSQ